MKEKKIDEKSINLSLGTKSFDLLSPTSESIARRESEEQKQRCEEDKQSCFVSTKQTLIL